MTRGARGGLERAKHGFQLNTLSSLAFCGSAHVSLFNSHAGQKDEKLYVVDDSCRTSGTRVIQRFLLDSVPFLRHRLTREEYEEDAGCFLDASSSQFQASGRWSTDAVDMNRSQSQQLARQREVTATSEVVHPYP